MHNRKMKTIARTIEFAVLVEALTEEEVAIIEEAKDVVEIPIDMEIAEARANIVENPVI